MRNEAGGELLSRGDGHDAGAMNPGLACGRLHRFGAARILLMKHGNTGLLLPGW